MFLHLKTLEENDNDLSWILSKHPDNVIVKNEGSRSAEGRFTAPNTYQIVVRNDALETLKRLRQENALTYVSAEQWLVCPYNLKSIADVLRSTLAGKNGSQSHLSDERFNAKKRLSAEMGPFPLNLTRGTLEPNDTFFVSVFRSLSIEAVRTTSDEVASTVANYEFTTVEPCSVTEFVQKLWVCSLAFTFRRGGDKYASREQIDRYVRLAKDWLGSSEHAMFIVNRLSSYRSDVAALVEAQLTQDQAAIDEMGEKYDDAPGIEKVSLHELRHDAICRSIVDHVKANRLYHVDVLDLGSSEGKLLTKIVSAVSEGGIEVKIASVEADESKIRRIKGRLGKAKVGKDVVKLYNESIVWPYRWFSENAQADVVVCTEVIEHLQRHDRGRLIHRLCNMRAPLLILTTPNVEYNATYGMEPGELRHRDHKVEYDLRQLQEEVVGPLSSVYDVEFITLHGEPGDMQSTFFLRCKRKADVKLVHRDEAFNDAFGPMYFPQTGLSINRSSLKAGFIDSAFLQGSNDTFYLGPTIAPVDYVWGDDVLEHPRGAFDYYAKRGVRYLVEQEKLMGSRAYVLVFRTLEHARALGFEHVVTVKARTGNDFFRAEHKHLLDAIHADVVAGMRDDVDFVALDTEITPWSVKGRQLIVTDFLVPGEAALLWRTEHGTEAEKSSARAYIASLKNHTKDEDVKVNVFNVLAMGGMKHGEKGLVVASDTVKLGFHRSLLDTMRTDVVRFEGNVVKGVRTFVVDLDDDVSMAASVLRWTSYTEAGGEGFVYKLLKHEQMENGHPLQPALKVRGKEYLRIIYGMDYLEPELFDQLKRRGTKRKRMLAAQQHEIGMQVLKTFLRGQTNERIRTIAAFLSHDTAVGPTVDRTL